MGSYTVGENENTSFTATSSFVFMLVPKRATEKAGSTLVDLAEGPTADTVAQSVISSHSQFHISERTAKML